MPSCHTFDSILLTVEELGQSQDARKAVEARGLLHQLNSFSFLVSLITFDRILTCTKQLSDKLQSSSLDLSSAAELVSATKSLLTEYRTTSYWKKIYDYTVDVAKLHDITVTFHSTTKEKEASRLEDVILLETVGSRDIDDNSTSDELKCHLYFPVLDRFLSELNSRFDDKNLVLMKGASAWTHPRLFFYLYAS